MKYATLLFVLASLSALGQGYDQRKHNDSIKAEILGAVEKFKGDSCNIPTLHGVSYAVNKRVEKMIKDSVDLRDFDGLEVRLNVQVMGSCDGRLYIDRLFVDDSDLTAALVQVSHRLCKEVSRLNIGPLNDENGVQYQPHYIGFIDLREGKAHRVSLN